MLQSVLPGWEKAPHKLIELKERLSAHGPHTWAPNRLILQNYWRFGYEEFHFVQGRLILRGSNGAGKSTVLVSAITLALDMEKRRERLDTFGGQGRGAAFYLVGEPDASPDADFYHFERTSYIALEFKNPAGEYRTIGVGLYTSRNRPDLAVDAWGFLINDGRRVGIDIHLYDESHIPLSYRLLRDLLGSGGQVFERSAEYQAQVNASLFGFSSLAEYEFLLSLLLQLRSPKLNKDTKPSDIREMLADSLPPLPAHLLDQAVQIIEDIDACLEHLEETEAQQKATAAIDERQALYLNQMAQQAAVDYLAVERTLQSAQQAEAAASAQLNAAKAQMQDIEAQLEQNEVEERQAQGRLDVLENHEAFREQKTLETLAGDLEVAQTAVKAAETNLAQSTEAYQRAVKRYEQQLERWRELRNTIMQHRLMVNDAAAAADWPLAAQMAQQVSGVCADLPQEYPPADKTLSDAITSAAINAATKERVQQLNNVRQALIAEERAQQQHQTAISAVERAKADLDDVGQQLVRAEEAYTAKHNAAIEAVQAWSSTCIAHTPEPEALAQTLTALAAFQPSDEYAALRRAYQPLLVGIGAYRQRLGDQMSQIMASMSLKNAERQDLIQQLHEWQAEKDPAPKRRAGQDAARQLLSKHGINAYPLYSCCEFAANLSPDIAAQLEQTLDEAGVLDALVVPQVSTEQVSALLNTNGLGDRWLQPVGACEHSGSAAVQTASLLAVLQPVDGHPAAEDVRLALSSIAWYETDAELENSGAANAFAPHAWRMGAVRGQAELAQEPVVRYVGEENRRRRRARIISELQEKVRAIDIEIWDLNNSKDELRKRLDLLHKEQTVLEDLPVWSMLWGAALATLAAKHQVERCTGVLQQAEVKANQHYQALLAARNHLQQAMDGIPEARGRNQEGILGLIDAAHRFAELLGQMQRQAQEAMRLRHDVDHTALDVEKAKQRIESDKAAYATSRRHAEELAARHAAVVEHMAQLGVSIVALHQEISSLKSTLAGLRQTKERLFEQRGKTEAEIVNSGNSLEKAKQELVNQLEAEATQKQELAARLRAYPTLARQLSLLESSRDGAKLAAQELLRARRAEEARLREAVDKGIREALQQLTTAVNDGRSVLAEYGPELLEGVATFREMGTVLPPYRLRRKLESDLAIQRQVLREKESELYESIILREIARHLRERIALAQGWCDEVNNLLADRKLSNGETISIQWRTRPADRITGYDPGRVVSLLRRDVETLTDDEVNELVEHFRQRVGEVRTRYKENALGDSTFASALEEVLDYREWFAFHLFSRMPGDERREMTDIRFAARSGGEKSLAMFIPILAAVYARYKSARADAPRLIGLDEAFAGVDEQNIKEMFRFLVELDFSWIMTSEKLWGVADSLPGCATYELVKGAGGVVTPIWFVWDGRKLVDAFSN